MSEVAEWIGLAIGVVTLASLLIGFVALIAKAATATATVESLRGDIIDKDRKIAELKDQLADEKTARLALQAQVDVLDERVTQRARVDELQTLMAQNFELVMTDLRETRTALVAVRQDLKELRETLGEQR